MTLEQTKKYAQAEANRQQRSVTIWNLNRYSPLYVVRDARQGDDSRDGYVALVEPTTERRAADDPHISKPWLSASSTAACARSLNESLQCVTSELSQHIPKP
jgi:hypothetical protein